MADQAVVIIHGMGSQRPMRFLRDFVRAALPRDASGKEPEVFSQPDPISGSFELRRIRALRTEQRPVTHLYELYWAHQMSGSEARHLLAVIKRVFVRWPWRVGGSLRFAWLLFWGLLAGLAWLWAQAELGGGSKTALTVVSLLFTRVLLAPMVASFGDVARYIDPAPDNVAVRQAIRTQAVELLDRLHATNVDRIVVVAHSLGSFVALDALKFLWSDYYCRPGKLPDDAEQPALAEVERLGEALEAARDDEQRRDALLGPFREAQRALWREQRKLGNPWKVTDLVTLGSPLTHAHMLLGSRRLRLDELVRLRELPSCPPVQDTTGGYGYVPGELPGVPKKGTQRIHHGALFAFTRWSNIWCPSRWGVFGDWFGGPLAGAFGPGISDRAVTSGPGRLWPVWAHVQYFSVPEGEVPADSSVGLLREAMDLESASWLR